MKIALGEEGTLMFQTVQYSLRKKKKSLLIWTHNRQLKEREGERDKALYYVKNQYSTLSRNLEKNLNVNKDYAINIVKWSS